MVMYIDEAVLQTYGLYHNLIYTSLQINQYRLCFCTVFIYTNFYTFLSCCQHNFFLASDTKQYTPYVSSKAVLPYTYIYSTDIHGSFYGPMMHPHAAFACQHSSANKCILLCSKRGGKKIIALYNTPESQRPLLKWNQIRKKYVCFTKWEHISIAKTGLFSL